MPARSTALMCTNTSFEPSVGWMNPKPFWLLKNFTVPVGIGSSLLDTPVNPDARGSRGGQSIRVLGDVQRSAQNRERSKAGRKPRLRALSIRAPMPRQTASRRAFELALLGNAFVRLARALDAVLQFVTLGGQNADHLVDATAVTAAEQARDDVNVVANAELVSQGSLRITQNTVWAATMAVAQAFVMGTMSL